MRQDHVPLLGLRYWIALCIASIFGANMGDFFAHNFGLGHVAGLPFLAIALALVFAVERFDRTAHEAYYWLAIVIVRTAATNLADFFSVDLKLGKPSVMAGLTALLATSIVATWQLVWRDTADKADPPNNLLFADSGYWIAMLAAGTLGTVIGDYFSHDLQLGHAAASVALSVLLAPFFVIGARRLLWPLPIYWATIVMIRAAGTAIGDVLAERNHLGLALSTALTGLVFVAFLISWRGSRRSALAASTY